MLFVPALTPLTFHWYAGINPPLTGVAVNVAFVPAQTGFDNAEMELLTGMAVQVPVMLMLSIPQYHP